MFKHALVGMLALALHGAAMAQAPAADGAQAAEAVAEQAPAAPEHVLNPMSGRIPLPAAGATLEVGDAHRFYAPDDARTILVDIWGNPPETADGVLGMILPTSEAEDWAAVITYAASGYVSDKEADAIDYAALLREMQEETRAASRQRAKEGYGTVELIGWAEPPRYDAVEHKLFWARELLFNGEQRELNYDMRVLGRSGVLNLNFLASIDQLDAVKAAAPRVLAIANFDEGSRYADYRQGDKTAAYGLAGLIAGGAGLAAAKKLGLFAVALAFLKKGWVLIPIVLAAGGRFILGLFRRKPAPPAM